MMLGDDAGEQHPYEEKQITTWALEDYLVVPVLWLDCKRSLSALLPFSDAEPDFSPL
jgi:hypothetical protein